MMHHCRLSNIVFKKTCSTLNMCGGNAAPCHTDGEHFSEKSLDKKMLQIYCQEGEQRWRSQATARSCFNLILFVFLKVGFIYLFIYYYFFILIFFGGVVGLQFACLSVKVTISQQVVYTWKIPKPSFWEYSQCWLHQQGHLAWTWCHIKHMNPSVVPTT